jgi:hypothetical protein
MEPQPSVSIIREAQPRAERAVHKAHESTEFWPGAWLPSEVDPCPPWERISAHVQRLAPQGSASVPSPPVHVD